MAGRRWPISLKFTGSLFLGGDFNDRVEQVQPERNLRSAFNERFNRVHSLDKGKHDLFIVIDVYLLR